MNSLSTPITRPTSSASVRPSSSAQLRPPSSASTLRPSSSLGSNRPISRLSQRPGSRLSRRPSLKQASRITPLTQALVTQITGITAESDADNFRIATEYVIKNLETSIGGSSGQDMSKMDQHFYGLAKKARIQSHDDLASAIDLAYKTTKERVLRNVDLDDEIKISRLPDHLQLLVLLSDPPQLSTLRLAETYLETTYNPITPVRQLTWQDILAEEPFEGQHWEGAYGLPPGSTVENWDNGSNGSTPSLSPWDDESDDQGEYSISPTGSARSLGQDVSESLEMNAVDRFAVKLSPQPFAHRDIVEELKTRQYWRPEWRIGVDIDQPFNLGDPSTLGPSIRKILPEDYKLGFDEPETERYIHEHHAVREVLMGLQSHENFLLRWQEDALSFEPSSSPRLPHLTIMSQLSILTSFASTATTVQHLRRFVFTILRTSTESPGYVEKMPPVSNTQRRYSRTLEAFADALEFEIRTFDIWCSSKEEEICRAHAGLGNPIIVSFLSLEKSIRDEFSFAFNVLSDVLTTVTNRIIHKSSSHASPHATAWNLAEIQDQVPLSAITSILLDVLLQSVQEASSLGDKATSSSIMRVFAKTAEPVWSMIGTWLQNGMPIHDVSATLPSSGMLSGLVGAVDKEFFIEDNEIGLLDPDFWAEGYVLREMDVGDRARDVPVFIEHVAGEVLSAGKAVGLLRALGDPHLLDGATEIIRNRETWEWRSFGSLTNASNTQSGAFITYSEVLPTIVHDELYPQCVSAQETLTKVLINDCDLWNHLHAIEDCYLMKRGESMSHFLDTLFIKMDSSQPWHDFHSLNTAFRDVAEASSQKWIDPSLVRLSYRGNKGKATERTIKSIDPLLVEYAVPFPLTYIFGPQAVQSYSSIFVWLVQAKRAHSVLGSILMRGAAGADGLHTQNELKVFYAMRSKLSWFVNTLLNFVSTYVIEVEVLRFHKQLRKAKSLDEIIRLHENHLENLQSRCFLLSKNVAIYRAIMSILELCLHFTQCFVAFAGDATHDFSSQQLLHMKKHRSKRLRKQRRNIVGFSTSLREMEAESESNSDSEDEGLAPPEPSFSNEASATISFSEESFLSRVDKMSTELDGLVRFIRRGVEALAGGNDGTASNFGILAFNLEDWDRG